MSMCKGLFIGLTTIDIQYFAEEFPDSNVKTKSAPPEILVGGPAANAAVAFAKLNGDASLASAVGKNIFSDFIIEDFHKTNVSLVDLAENKDFNPVVATVVTSLKNGDRNIFTHEPQEIVGLNFSTEQIFEIVKPQIIMLDGFYPEFGIQCVKIAKQKNIPVVLDCGSWKPQYEELLDFADVAICSENFYPQNTVNSQQVLSYLEQKRVKYFAISRGEKPILFYDNGEINQIEIKHKQIVDSLGAGDILHGVFCYYFLQENNFKTALKKSSEIATFSCKYKGTREWLTILH